MPKDSRKIRFIRKNGKIIPISDKRKKQIGKGAGLIAGGVAIAAGSGEAASRSVKASASLRLKSKKMFSIYRKHTTYRKKGQLPLSFAPKLEKLKRMKTASIGLRIASKSLFSLRNPLLAFPITIGGGAVLGAGVTQLYEGVSGKRSNIAADIGTSVFTTSLMGLAAAYYYKRLGLKGFSKIAKYIGKRAAGKKTFSNIPIVTKHGTLKFKGVGF